MQAGRCTSTLQLLVRTTSNSSSSSSASPFSTRLALLDGCVDASWLKHAPSRFVALLRAGSEVQLFDGTSGAAVSGAIALRTPVCRTWALGPALVGSAGTGMLLHAAFAPAAAAAGHVEAAATARRKLNLETNDRHYNAWGDDGDVAAAAARGEWGGAGMWGWAPTRAREMPLSSEGSTTGSRGPEQQGSMSSSSGVDWVQLLGYSHTRDPNLAISDSRVLALHVGERLVEVLEQPLGAPQASSEDEWGHALLWADPPQPSTTAAGAAGSTNAASDAALLPGLPLLVLHTTERLLVVNTNLVIVATCEAGGKAILSVAWLGATLVALTDTGEVLYWSILSANPRGCVLSPRPLLTLAPATMAGGGGGAIAAVFPDRLVFVTVPLRSDGRSPRPRLYMKPLLPLEPLLVGLVAAVSASTIKEPNGGVIQADLTPSQRRRAALIRLAGAVACRHSPLGASTIGEGLGLHAGASATAIAALHYLGLDAHAAAVAGVVESAVALDSYPRRPWLAPTDKGMVAQWAGRWSDAVLEALGDAPELQAYAQTALEDRKYKSQDSSRAPPPPVAPHTEVVARVLALAAAVGRGDETAAAVAAEAVGMPGHAIPDEAAVAPTSATAVVVGIASSGARSRASVLTPLRLHRAEEWMGRARPECAALEDDGSQDNDLMVSDSASGSDALPDGWTPGIGAGKKDEQNLVGYWRFSEGSESSEACLPPGTACADLSGMGVAAQIVGSEMRYAPCSCSLLDEGEEATTHVAYDLCYPSSSSSSGGPKGGGLLLDCARGSALEAGLLHRDPHRSALTVEFWVKVPLESGEEHTGSGSDDDDDDKQKAPALLPWEAPVTLMARQLGECEVWGLKLCPDGALVLALAGCPEALVTGASAVKAGKWAHVALTIGTKESLWDANKPTIPQPCKLALFVNGAPAVDGQAALALPPKAIKVLTASSEESEDQAAASKIAVGFELGHSCRMTELRFWACLRKVSRR